MHWIDIQTQSPDFKKKIVVIPCISQNCSKEISLIELYSALPETFQTQFNAILVNNSKKPPNNCAQGINQIPIIPQESVNPVKKMIKALFGKIWAFFFVARCPKCKIYIEQNNYSEMIICPKCKLQFCRSCRVQASRHHFFEHDKRFRFLRFYQTITKFTIYLLLGFVLDKIPYFKPFSQLPVINTVYSLIKSFYSMFFWIYLHVWRLAVGLMYCQFFFRELFGKKTSTVLLVSSVIITYIYTDDFEMVNIVIMQALTLKLLELVLKYWKSLKRSKTVQGIGSLVKPCWGLSLLLMPLGQLFFMFCLFPILDILFNAFDIDIKDSLKLSFLETQ